MCPVLEIVSGLKTLDLNLILAGIVLSACLPIHTSTERFTGVACADMPMRDLIQNIGVFHNLDVGYMFMFNAEGETCMFWSR